MSCPCEDYKNSLLTVHCWRTYSYDKDGSKCDCEFAGVHYSDDIVKDIAEQLAKELSIKWNAEFAVSKLNF